MNFDQILSFVTHHSESMIQWIFLAILLLAGFIVAKGLFFPSKKSVGSDATAVVGSSPELQAAIQKIMDQTAKLESLSFDQMTPADVSTVGAEVKALRAEVAAKEAEIAELKNSPVAAAAAGGSAGGQVTGDLANRLKELEAKLAEYEILEDDIADLSLYKEENARLRGELEKLKAGGEDIVAEFAEAVEKQSQAEPEVEAEPEAEASELAATKTDDPMADFESAIKMETPGSSPILSSSEQESAVEEEAPSIAAAVTDASPKSAPAAPVPTPSNDVDSAASVNPATEESEDLFAEFSSSTDEGELDTDKMMSEMAELVGMSPAGEDALSESIDTEKMAAEAAGFGKS